jgi:uncharacterized membrane protein
MADTHPNARLEALSDGVFAIAMTLLILDVRIPEPQSITSTAELWRALGRLAPSVFAFLLSFGVILITWVNHHAYMKLVNGTTASFLYANGFLLLAVVSIPFSTSLLGDFLWTDHASPAVALYDAVLAMAALGWILVGNTVIDNHLVTDERSHAAVRDGRRNGYLAVGLYALLAIVALWFPVTAATLTTLTWTFWLVLGIRMKHL